MAISAHLLHSHHKSDLHGLTPLHHAALEGKVETLRDLWAAGHALDGKENNGRTALHLASAHKQTEALEALVTAGADIKARDHKHNMALHTAAQHGHALGIEILMRAGACTHASNCDGRTPLHVAAQHGQKDAVPVLLGRSASTVETPDDHGNTALHLAAEAGHEETLRALLASGALVGARNKIGATALHLAVIGGHTTAIKILLAASSNVRTADYGGRTPLHVAAYFGWADAMRMLITASAKIDAEDSNGCTPLHVTAMKENLECMQLLLAAGADIEAEKADKLRPIHVAVHYGRIKAYELLVAASANTAALDSFDSSLLHIAATAGHVDLLAKLLDTGFAIEAADKDGRRPLHLAALEDHLECVKLLLDRGASPMAPNNDGQSAYVCGRFFESAAVFSEPRLYDETSFLIRKIALASGLATFNNQGKLISTDGGHSKVFFDDCSTLSLLVPKMRTAFLATPINALDALVYFPPDVVIFPIFSTEHCMALAYSENHLFIGNRGGAFKCLSAYRIDRSKITKEILLKIRFGNRSPEAANKFYYKDLPTMLSPSDGIEEVSAAFSGPEVKPQKSGNCPAAAAKIAVRAALSALYPLDLEYVFAMSKWSSIALRQKMEDDLLTHCYTTMTVLHIETIKQLNQLRHKRRLKIAKLSAFIKDFGLDRRAELTPVQANLRDLDAKLAIPLSSAISEPMVHFV